MMVLCFTITTTTKWHETLLMMTATTMEFVKGVVIVIVDKKGLVVLRSSLSSRSSAFSYSPPNFRSSCPSILPLVPSPSLLLPVESPFHLTFFKDFYCCYKASRRLLFKEESMMNEWMITLPLCSPPTRRNEDYQQWGKIDQNSL